MTHSSKRLRFDVFFCTLVPHLYESYVNVLVTVMMVAAVDKEVSEMRIDMETEWKIWTSLL